MRLAFMHRRLAGGGTEADLRRLCVGLAGRGHDVHAFVARADAAPPGVTVHRVPTLRAGRAARLLSFAFLAPRAAGRGRFDLVVGFGRTPRQDVVRVGGGTHRTYLARMEAAGLRGRARGPYHRAVLWLEAAMLGPRGHRRVLAVSRRVADEVTSDYAVPPASIAVVYNGVDLERFHPGRRALDGPAVRAELGLGDRAVCLAVGTGFARKGFDVLIDLWGEGPPRDAMLVVVGGDERLGHYRRLAAAGGRAGRVVVTGPRPDVERLLAAADVLCLPSRQEAFGNVVLEAWAAGVPVVTSRRAGAAELFDAASADLLVDDPEDRAGLAAAIGRALADAPARGRAARVRAEAFPWSAHLDRVERLFAEVAGGR